VEGEEGETKRKVGEEENEKATKKEEEERSKIRRRKRRGTRRCTIVFNFTFYSWLILFRDMIAACCANHALFLRTVKTHS
jgi:hypothetical protein